MKPIPIQTEVVARTKRGENISDSYGDGSYSIDSDYFFFRGYDAHDEIPAEFWYHAEVVLGKVCEYRPAYFSCSC